MLKRCALRFVLSGAILAQWHQQKRRALLSSKSNASQSVSRAAIGDTGNNDNPPNTSVNGTATANMEDGVATTPDMPQAWSDTFMEGDLEDYVRKLCFLLLNVSVHV